MECLDDPTVLAIFSFLDSVSILKISGVLSKHYYVLSRENSLWVNLLKREFGADRYLEKYKTNVMQAFKVAKCYRKIAAENIATIESVDAELKSANVREFINIIELKRGGIVLCTDGNDNYRRLIVNAIVHMLFCYPDTSIYCSWEGIGPSLYNQTAKSIDANIRKEDKRGMVSHSLNYNFGFMVKKSLENGSAFFYHRMNTFWHDPKRTYHPNEIFINILCGDALHPRSPSRCDASHMLDENTWPQENTIHVVTTPHYFGGELHRLWEHKHLKWTVESREGPFPRGYFDCLIDLRLPNSVHERIVIDTKLLCDGRLNSGEGNDREGLWKRFTNFHMDIVGRNDDCFRCKEFKKQKIQ